MKRSVIFTAAVLVACGVATALLLHRPAAPTSVEASTVATIATVAATKVSVPVLVTAYGDIGPDQTQAISFARPGQLTALNVVVGQRVLKGVTLARFTDDPLAEAALHQARSALALADGEERRLREMFALQLATTSQVETAHRITADARSALDAQQKLGAGSNATEARAPFDGVVTVLSAAQGDRLAAGAPVMQLGRIDRLRANLGIEPSDLPFVKVGSVAMVSAQTGSPDAERAAKVASVQGRVQSLQGVLDAKTQLVSAVISLPSDAIRMLVPGMRVGARIQTGVQGGWSLPRQAVLSDEKGSYVYEAKNGVAHRITVVPLSQSADTVMVDGPLSSQTQVVSLGNYELTDGMAVVEKKP